jgi:3-hydroxybutyryl-CoA dehydratase
MFIEDLAVAQSAHLVRTVRDADLVSFAALTGDENPVHLDEDYASRTPFGRRIAHGMLSAGFISAVIGTRLPGPGAIYVAQTLRFRRPVHIGDSVSTRVQIVDIDAARGRVRLETVCSVDGITVLDGEAEVMVPRRQR